MWGGAEAGVDDWMDGNGFSMLRGEKNKKSPKKNAKRDPGSGLGQLLPKRPGPGLLGKSPGLLGKSAGLLVKSAGLLGKRPGLLGKRTSGTAAEVRRTGLFPRRTSSS